MNKESFVWGTVLILTVLLFLFWIPISLYNTASVITSMIGGAIVGGILYIFLKSLKSKDEHYSPIGPAIVTAILISIVFIYNAVTKETRLLQSEGIITTATIVDGYSIESRRGGIYEITVRFKDERGKTLTVSTTIGENSFNKVGKGQEISVIYYPKDPNILNAILTEEDINNYILGGDKGLKIDFSVMDELKSSTKEEIDEYFKKYTLWQYEGTSKYGEHWINTTTSESIYMNQGQIIYTHEDLSDLSKIRMDLVKNGFRLTDKEDTPEIS